MAWGKGGPHFHPYTVPRGSRALTTVEAGCWLQAGSRGSRILLHSAGLPGHLEVGGLGGLQGPRAPRATQEESEGSRLSPGFPTIREFLLKTWKPSQAAFTQVLSPPQPLFQNVHVVPSQARSPARGQSPERVGGGVEVGGEI